MKNKTKYQIKENTLKGYGIFATQQIQPDTILVSISNEDFITCQIVEDFYQFSKLSYDRNLSSKVVFSYLLAAAEIIAQNIRPQYLYIVNYIHKLPRHVHGLINWDQRQLLNLNNLNIISKVLTKKQQIQNEYKIIRNQIQKIWEIPQMAHGQYRFFTKAQQIDKVSLNLIFKYCSVIESRGIFYSCNYKCDQNVGALVPQIDKLNHSSQPNCIVQIGLKYSIKALKKIGVGQQILVNYGNFDQDLFLEYYGFLPQWESSQSPNAIQYRNKLAQFYNKLQPKVTQDEQKSLNKQNVNYFNMSQLQIQNRQRILSDIF